MSEPTIVCPSCKSDIKLTESLAAPLIEATRKDYEQRLAQKNADVAKREASIQQKEADLAKAKESVEQQIQEKLRQERVQISVDEERKAKLAVAAEIEQKSKEFSELQEVLKVREAKLAEAQQAQADLLRKQRELDDARRELELTVEKRVQASVNVAREQTKKDMEEQLAGKMEEKEKAIHDMERRLGEAAKRDEEIKKKEADLAQEKESLATKAAELVAQERAKIAAEESKKAKSALSADMDQKVKEVAELQQILKERNDKLAEAQNAQADLIRKQRELDDAKREMELTVEKRVQESIGKTREQAKKEAEEQLGLKVMEREETIRSMQKQIEELKRKSEQGSQQLQGEVQELQLEQILSARFPHDRIDPVPKGEYGGDLLQRVITPTGATCGTILWESKRTKNWSDGWLPKLREDQRRAKAEIAVIVSATLPKGVETFDQIDDVWITHPRAILPVALSLRHMLIEVHCARQASEGQQTKMEMVYQYLTGPKFRLRVHAIVEAFTNMANDLQKEKKAIMKQWAKRDEEIARVMEATIGMYGELQGIAGKSLKEVEGLDLKTLAAGNEAED